MSMLFDKGSDDEDDDQGGPGYKPSKLPNSGAKAKPKPKKSLFAKEESSDSDEFKPVKKEPTKAGLPSIGKPSAKPQVKKPEPVPDVRAPSVLSNRPGRTESEAPTQSVADL